MGHLAVIAEFNPFHNGHAYLLEQAGSICRPDATLALMSGNFVQRGEISPWNKFVRAEMACRAGVDAVFELPVPYATGSARDFAAGAVHILEALGTISHLAFGVEADDTDVLRDIAAVLAEEPEDYRAALSQALSTGLSFPKARKKALSSLFQEEALSVLDTPNNILAIEYLTALKKIGSDIEPVMVKREGSSYHDTLLGERISSASAIRNALRSELGAEKLSGQLPEAVSSLLALPAGDALSNELFSPYIQSFLLHPSLTENICDFSQSLRDKFSKCPATSSYREVIDFLKSKDITHTRIARALLHSILLYREEDRELFVRDGYAYYASLLALKKSAGACLKKIQDMSRISIITKKADFAHIIQRNPAINPTGALRMWQLDQKATDFYNILYHNNYGLTLRDDCRTPLPVIED